MNALEGRHNHPPRCCCSPVGKYGTTSVDRCPLCPEHGELTPSIECPQCHQPIGRPHTDFCTLAPDRVWPGEALCGFRSLANTSLVCSYPPHPVNQMHSWQDGGDPRGWRNAIDPNKP